MNMRCPFACIAFGLILLLFVDVKSSAGTGGNPNPSRGAVLEPSENPHPFTVHDLLAMDRISDPRVSPEGKRVVFALRVTDLDANKGRTDLWLVNADGTGLRRLTSNPAGDSDPAWHPDGRTVYFLSPRSGSSQVSKIAVDGGEAQQVTDQPLDINAFKLSPDGGSIALVMDVFPGLSPADTRKKIDEIKSGKASGRIYEKLFVRHWDAWSDGRRSHVLILPSDGKGTPVDIMHWMDADAPSKPFGGVDEIAFTPDGKNLVFTAKDAGREEAWSTDYNLYLAPVDGSRHAVCLTPSNRAWDTSPVFSPDGKTLAYLAMSRPGYEADRFRIVLRAWPDGTERVLTENWDRSAGELFWAEDGKTIFTAADHLGQHSLFAVDVRTGNARCIVEKGTVRSPRTAGDRLLFGLDHLKSPVELYSVRPDGKDPKKLTGINAGKLAAVRLGEPEQFTFEGWNGETVYGYVVKPADFDPSRRRYPVAFIIHGGPQGSMGNDFHYRWNPQTYAGAGYAAVMIDFHGSTGYGQAFTDAIRGDWGGKPLEDLKKGLAAALEKYPWMDGGKVGALGASYGGYMINWIAGNWPGGFRCLVCHDGNVDEKMAYYDTEELWFPEWDHMGTPWTNPEGYEKQNPVNFVKNWKLPMLIIHSGRDYRVVDTQGLSAFTALQRMGIPSKLLYFPDENHWVLKPHNSILWHDTVLGWLDQWLKP
jgi:dipeptidyl aminopeptidase/acylaminoacyl peptidase